MGGIRRDIGGKKSVFARGLRDFGRVWKWERKIGALGLDGTEIWRKRPDRSFFPVLGRKASLAFERVRRESAWR